MSLSLKELKEYLILKGGYTIAPNHSQLMDLKQLVDNMIDVRNGAPPLNNSGYNSGVTCNGHQTIQDYNLSLGDIKNLDIKNCSCNTVDVKIAYCSSRTYSCSCNSYTNSCNCNTRTPSSCNCQNRTPYCPCVRVVQGTPCGCQENQCFCHGGYESECWCNARTAEPCSCQNRTSSCGSRNVTECQCNARCACNAEQRFE